MVFMITCTESLTYEDVEDEHTITPTAPKKEKSRKDKSKAETQSSGRKRFAII